MVADRIQFYSGTRGDETPRAILVGRNRYPIKRIIRSESVGNSMSEGGYHRVFLVETEDGSVWKIREAPEMESGWIAELIP